MMNFKLLISVTALFITVAATAQDEKVTFDKNKTSYAFGFRMGLEFLGRKDSEFDLDIEQAIKGIKDAYAKKEPTVSKEDMVLNYQAYENLMKQKQFEAFKKLADLNQTRSDDFLKENRKKKGIKELASGIQYRIIEDGSGKHPTLDDEVTINYRGSLISKEDSNNYIEFDSSFVRGQPKTLKVNQVIKGWQEIIPLMRPGGKWQIFVPPELAYGVRGQQPIGPNELLVFDLNLLSIK
jgi:FKBP-type peptidyl-prolyl cis-trans isomerase FklB